MVKKWMCIGEWQVPLEKLPLDDSVAEQHAPESEYAHIVES